MKIAFISKKDNGCYWVRVKQPGDALKERGHEVTVITGEGEYVNFGDYDLVVMGRISGPEIKPIVDSLIRNGKPFVYDVDDLVTEMPPHNFYSAPINRDIQSFYYMIANAAAVTTTTDRLRDEVKKYTYAPVYVIPNCVDKKDWNFDTQARDPGAPTRFCFAGSATHTVDVCVMLEAFALAEKQAKMELLFMGFSHSHPTAEAWIEENRAAFKAKGLWGHPVMQGIERFAEAWAKVENKTWIPAALIEDYHRRLEELQFDFGLAPLIDDRFNASKSCVKAYEYAMAGAETLASDVMPYSKEPFTLVPNTVTEWTDALVKAATEGPTNVHNDQTDWVAKHRDIDKEVVKWEMLFEQVVQKKA